MKQRLSIFRIDFSWNVDGAFIGRIPLAEGPNQVDPLPFEFMLIVPLLDIKEEDTIRFNIPVNTHPTWSRINMADALNAFLHFSYLQSDRKLVFADLQGKYTSLLIRASLIGSIKGSCRTTRIA